MSSIIFLYSPYPSLEAARTAATMLLEAKLAACCNILPGAESHYWWEGELTSATEAILVAKTSPANAGKAAEVLEAAHPYKTPAILQFSAEANLPFAQWVRMATNL